MDISLEMNYEQSMRVSPTLIAVNHILALSSQELQAAIKQEAEENPALEIVEHQLCRTCGEPLRNGICLGCARGRPNRESPIGLVDDFGYDSYGYSEDGAGGDGRYSSMVDGEEFDPVSLVAAEPSMRERLLLDLRSTLEEGDFPVAEYLVDSFDDKGFLTAEPTEVALALGVPLEQVEQVLFAVQHVGPPGIGARDPRECLLLELEYMQQETGEEMPHARAILEKYFVELGEHKYAYIAQKLGISPDAVRVAREFIRNNLTPYPVMWSDEVATWGSQSKAQYVAPDVIIKEVDGQLEVEVVESRRFFMRLNPLYSEIASDLRGKSSAYSDDEKKHIQQYVSRTKLFMSNIRQRRETMTKIAQTLLARQEDFLKHGLRHLKPLTRAQVAEATGLHESTVSRATAGKFIMLPNRQVVPFSDFFTVSLGIKDVIKEIIEMEGKPVADREIVLRLRERGIRVARRTVAKYRSQLGILPSTLRS